MPEDAMREGSYAEIRPGMRVTGTDGHTIGSVEEVVVDEASRIFVGLAVRPNLFTHALLVPGEAVERLHDDVVYVNTVRERLQPYNTPSERRHDAVEAFEEMRA
jgi:sporulation protein YlmC with PRC-barrel domain